MENIILPRQDKDGNYYISYSQYNSFKSASGFNTGLPGDLEYMQGYFFKKRWEDQGWGLFGSQAEDYICYRDYLESEIEELDAGLIEQGQPTITEAINSFTKEERETLDTITPLGNFQVEVKFWLSENVYIYGFIDDATDDLSHIRDYKTASKNSKARYYKDDYKQLDIYALWARQQTGKIPEQLEVVIIERKGNCFGLENRRDLLSVGKEVWYLDRKTSEERLFQIEMDVKRTVEQISDMYKTYLSLQKFGLV